MNVVGEYAFRGLLLRPLILTPSSILRTSLLEYFCVWCILPANWMITQITHRYGLEELNYIQTILRCLWYNPFPLKCLTRWIHQMQRGLMRHLRMINFRLNGFYEVISGAVSWIGILKWSRMNFASVRINCWWLYHSYTDRCFLFLEPRIKQKQN